MSSIIQFAKKLGLRMQEADTATHAAALAYNFLFALFPLLLFLAALLGLFHLPRISQYIQGPLSVVLAPDLRRLILRVISEASRFKSPTLLSVGAFGFIWAMSAALHRLTLALNFAYGITKPTRPWWQNFVLCVGMGLFLGTLLVVSEILAEWGSDIARWLSLVFAHPAPAPILIEAMRWLVVLLFMWIILTIIYNWLPEHHAHFRWFSTGTGVVMCLWVLIIIGFSMYTSGFSYYNQTYGSIGVVILLMLYLYILSFALLLGGEIDALRVQHANSARLTPTAHH